MAGSCPRPAAEARARAELVWQRRAERAQRRQLVPQQQHGRPRLLPAPAALCAPAPTGKTGPLQPSRGGRCPSRGAGEAAHGPRAQPLAWPAAALLQLRSPGHAAECCGPGTLAWQEAQETLGRGEGWAGAGGAGSLPSLGPRWCRARPESRHGAAQPGRPRGSWASCPALWPRPRGTGGSAPGQQWGPR